MTYRMLRPLSVLVIGMLACATAQAQTFRDRDLVRMAAEITSAVTISETTETLDGVELSFTRVENSQGPGRALFLILHDDEQDAFRAAFRVVQREGGTLVALENRERRYLGSGADPNRIFGLSDRSEYLSHFAELVQPFAVVIAVHNNTDGFQPDTGNVSLFNPKFLSPSRICNNGGDEDDLIFSGGTNGPMACTEPLAAAFATSGINFAYVVYQDRGDQAYSCTSSCNLQTWLISSLGKRYFNVEAQHGHLDQQEKMLIFLMTLG